MAELLVWKSASTVANYSIIRVYVVNTGLWVAGTRVLKLLAVLSAATEPCHFKAGVALE